MSRDRFLVRLDSEKLAGGGMEPYEPFPDEIVLSGKSRHEKYEFHNDELFVGAYSAAPVKLLLNDYPQDEFMYLLSGKIIISDENGLLEEFVAGDALVLRKGFCGTFEMQGDVRKIAVICGNAKQSLQTA